MATSNSASADTGDIIIIACYFDVDDARLQCGDHVARRAAAILGNFPDEQKKSHRYTGLSWVQRMLRCTDVSSKNNRGELWLIESKREAAVAAGRSRGRRQPKLQESIEIVKKRQDPTSSSPGWKQIPPRDRQTICTGYSQCHTVAMQRQ